MITSSINALAASKPESVKTSDTQIFNGNYSWMLYGDDDTLFFIDSVSELLQDFDPSLPYFISGMGGSRNPC